MRVPAAENQTAPAQTPIQIPVAASVPQTQPASTPAPAPAPAPAQTSASNSAALAASLNRLAASFLAQKAAVENASNSAALTEILDQERIIPMVESDSKLAESLLQYLPPDQRQPSDLALHLRSPQFRQSLARLTALLNSENFGNVMGSLGLPIDKGFGVDAFLEAIEQLAKKEAEQKGDDKMKD